MSDRQLRPDGDMGVGLPRDRAMAFSGVGIGRCDDRCDPVCVLSSCLPCGGAAQSGETLGVAGSCAWWVCGPVLRVSTRGVGLQDLEREKGIRWMPWHQEAMKDVARCEKPWGAASRR